MATALVVAAGRGERLGVDGPKAFAPLAGRPMLAWSLDVFHSVEAIGSVVVAVPPGWLPTDGPEADALRGCTICEGGAERSLSVRNALAASEGPDDEPVLVHDAARPLVTADLIERMIAAVEGDGGETAWVAAAPVTDTIRVADAGGNVVATPDRATLRAMQTPQAFRRSTLGRALAQDESLVAAATDDAALVEAMGGSVRLIEAPVENIKVTNPLDLRIAESLLSGRGGR